ncbi:MAG: DUF2170 family protein [Methylococcales bacterium]|nr:DUF2170 family protein [Methylococcales bacterium]
MSWTPETLAEILGGKTDYAVEAESSTVLRISNPEGIDAYIALSGEQILIESLLFAKAQVKNPAALNEDILKTHHTFPLTAIAINSIDGEDYYLAFGALSTESSAENIVLEIDYLFRNVEAFLEAYQEHLNLEVA